MTRLRLIKTAGLVLGLQLLAWNTTALAQHQMHGAAEAGTQLLATMPANNEVLARAPDFLMLHFGTEVALVKLAIKNPASKIVDIGFRFDPSRRKDFSQTLPQLPAADYFAVEWATLDLTGKLERGSFYFSFGDDARPPSYYLERLDHPMHIMSPDYRLLQ